jgi:serine/threonine protein phosphatase 1
MIRVALAGYGMMLPQPHDTARFGILKGRHRIWAIASIHADVARLEAVHDAIAARLHTGDGLVYLGNMLGYGTQVAETIKELLHFRRAFIARPGSFAKDLVYLRGAQEEMWQKLLELQLAPNPREIFDWMLGHGLGATLEGYGIRANDARIAMREGTLALTRWTASVRATLNAAPGHASLQTALRRAAYSAGGELLFVHAGVDPSRPMSAQRDSFWWGVPGFLELSQPFGGFLRVIRGFDGQKGGLIETPFAVSMDSGCGRGGKLLAACFALDGSIVESFEA